MIFQESIPMHPDDGTCNLYVHLRFINTKKDVDRIFANLQSTFHAIPILPMTSYYIKAEHLYSKNNLDSFVDEFTDLLGGYGFRADEYDLVVCPVHDILFLSADGTEIAENE